MISLFDYLLESRGIVTGQDDWSDLVDVIVKEIQSTTPKRTVVKCVGQI